jgi:hypothetical protein
VDGHLLSIWLGGIAAGHHVQLRSITRVGFGGIDEPDGHAIKRFADVNRSLVIHHAEDELALGLTHA